MCTCSINYYFLEMYHNAIDGDDPVSQLVLNNPEMNEFESEILRQATTSKQSAALVLLLLAMCE